MNRIRIMKDHIPRLKPTNQPLPPSLRPLNMETARIIGQLAKLSHIDIKRAHALEFRQRGRPTGEIVLDLAAQARGVGEIDEPPTIKRNVADGDPGRQEIRPAVAEEEFVVVDPRAEAVRDVVPQHGAAEEDLAVPGHEVADHGAQVRVVEEAEVVWEDVRGDELLDVVLGGWEVACADAGVVGWVGGGVEDAVDGLGAGFQDAGGGVVLEVFLAHVQDVFARDEVLDEEVTIFVQSLLEL